MITTDNSGIVLLLSNPAVTPIPGRQPMFYALS